MEKAVFSKLGSTGNPMPQRIQACSKPMLNGLADSLMVSLI